MKNGKEKFFMVTLALSSRDTKGVRFFNMYCLLKMAALKNWLFQLVSSNMNATSKTEFKSKFKPDPLLFKQDFSTNFQYRV